jgi:hypothetical protein
MEALEKSPKGGPRRARKGPQSEPRGAREGERGMRGRQNQSMGAPKKAAGSPKEDRWEPGKGPGKGPKRDPQEAWERAPKGALAGPGKGPQMDARGVWEEKKWNGERKTKSNNGSPNKSPMVTRKKPHRGSRTDLKGLPILSYGNESRDQICQRKPAFQPGHMEGFRHLNH